MHKLSRKRALAFALSLIMLLSFIPLSAGAVSFTDTAGHWAEGVIGTWSDYGIVVGDTGFRPDDPMTRGEFAVVVNRIMGYQTAAQNVYYDLEFGEWYTDAVLKLNAAGVMNGGGDGSIMPRGTLSREQAMVMLARIFGVAPNASAVYTFNDADEISAWAVAELGGMVAAGYTKGDAGMLTPKANLTRAQAVQLFDNIIKGFYNKAGTYTAVTDGIVVVNTTDVILDNSNIGSLYITPGVGSGDFTLRKSTTAKMTVMGGGRNSVNIEDSTVDNLSVNIDNSTGELRVHSAGATFIGNAEVAQTTETVTFTGDVGTIHVEAGSTVILQGSVTDVTIIGDNVTVIVESGAAVANLNVSGSGAAVDVAQGAAVDNVAIEGAGAVMEVAGNVGTVTVTGDSTTIGVASTGTVTGVTVSANNTAIAGDGKVAAVTVEAGAGNAVTTPNTPVANNSDTPVNTNAGEVAGNTAGSSGTETGGGTSGGSTSGGSTSGGSTSGGGGYTPSEDTGTPAKSSDASITAYNLGGVTNGTLGTPAAAYNGAGIAAGAVTINNVQAAGAAFSATKSNDAATLKYAKTTESTAPVFGNWTPTTIADNDFVWIQVTAEDGTTVLIYKIQVTVVTQSTAPAASVTTADKAAAANTSIDFTLTAAPTGTWRAYADNSTATVIPNITVSESALTLTIAAADSSPLPVGEYWVAVTESGKTESARLKLTVMEVIVLADISIDTVAPITGQTIPTTASNGSKYTVTSVGWGTDGSTWTTTGVFDESTTYKTRYVLTANQFYKFNNTWSTEDVSTRFLSTVSSATAATSPDDTLTITATWPETGEAAPATFVGKVTLNVDGNAKTDAGVDLRTSPSATSAGVTATHSSPDGTYVTGDVLVTGITYYVFVGGKFAGTTVTSATTAAAVMFTVTFTDATGGGGGTVTAKYADDNTVALLQGVAIASGDLVLTGSKVTFTVAKNVNTDTIKWGDSGSGTAVTETISNITAATTVSCVLTSADLTAISGVFTIVTNTPAADLEIRLNGSSIELFTTGSALQTYSVTPTNAAKVAAVLAQLSTGDTVTLGSGAITALTIAYSGADKTIALGTDIDGSAAIEVTNSGSNTLTITGTTNGAITVKGGKVDLKDGTLTGTITIEDGIVTLNGGGSPKGFTAAALGSGETLNKYDPDSLITDALGAAISGTTKAITVASLSASAQQDKTAVIEGATSGKTFTVVTAAGGATYTVTVGELTATQKTILAAAVAATYTEGSGSALCITDVTDSGFTRTNLTKEKFDTALSTTISDETLLVYQTIAFASKAKTWAQLKNELSVGRVNITMGGEYDKGSVAMRTIPTGGLITGATYGANTVTVTVNSSFTWFENSKVYSSGGDFDARTVLYGGFDPTVDSQSTWENPVFINGSALTATDGGGAKSVNRVVRMDIGYALCAGAAQSHFDDETVNYRYLANGAGQGLTYDSGTSSWGKYPVMRFYAPVAAITNSGSAEADATLTLARNDSKMNFVQVYIDSNNVVIGYSLVTLTIVNTDLSTPITMPNVP